MAKRIRKRDLIIEFLQLVTGIGVKTGKKAAPRFELGIKDLQSSALPLGHAAGEESLHSSPDRISERSSSLLVVCNGHGEDLIALRVIEAVHKIAPNLVIEVLPLVGEGNVFNRALPIGWLRKIGPSARLPSGGFSNQSFWGLVADVFSGLILLSWKQWRLIRLSARQGQKILAVGDFLPLFFAWSSGASFGFIGTPKSDYTWRSGSRKALSDFYHSLKGSEWDPWEYMLMRSARCRLVAVRDRLTARGLRRHGVLAQAPGNPMMDGFCLDPLPSSVAEFRRLLLLCGSRMPEAATNFKRLLGSLKNLDNQVPLVVFVPLGAQPTVQEIASSLAMNGFSPAPIFDQSIGADSCWVRGACFVLIGAGQFSRWAHWGEIGLANSGTATEQLVGLGVPALSLPGRGPQFTVPFAFRQSRLLGGSVILCKTQEFMTNQLKFLLWDDEYRKNLGLIGMRRMGPPGGSSILATLVLKLF